MGRVFLSCWTAKRTPRCFKKTAIFLFAPSPGFAFGRGDSQPRNRAPSAPIGSAEGTQPNTPVLAWHKRSPRLFQRTPAISTNSPVSLPFCYFFPANLQHHHQKVHFGYFSAHFFWPGGKHIRKSFLPSALIAHAIWQAAEQIVIIVFN